MATIEDMETILLGLVAALALEKMNASWDALCADFSDKNQAENIADEAAYTRAVAAMKAA